MKAMGGLFISLIELQWIVQGLNSVLFLCQIIAAFFLPLSWFPGLEMVRENCFVY